MSEPQEPQLHLGRPGPVGTNELVDLQGPEEVAGRLVADFRGTDVEFGLVAKKWGKIDIATFNAKAAGFGDLILDLRRRGFTLGEDGALAVVSDKPSFRARWNKASFE